MKRLVYSLIFFVIFIIDFVFMKLNNNLLDNFIYEKIMLIKCGLSTLFFKCITFLAGVKFITIVTIILFLLIIIFKKYKKLLIVINSIIEPIILKVTKHLIKRDRPNILRLVSEGGYSFPSGHSMIAILFYGSIIYLINRYYPKYKFINYILIPLIILIGISRIYLGVHYFTDVIGGFALGLSILNLSIYIYERKVKWKL